MKLTKNELLRYQRQIVLDECGIDGQIRLKKAKVVVIGAGGLGIPVLSYLAAAGVGHLRVIDHDTIHVSNLHRQILYSEEDRGKKKVDVIQKQLRKINPDTIIEAIDEQLTNQNAMALLKGFEVIVDATDNFSTRYLINDCSYLLNIPLVSASILRFEGQLCILNYNNGPSYRCLFPDPPSPEQIPNCSQAGVFGFLPAMLGSMQANEVIKILLDMGDVLSGQLWIYNSLSNQLQTIEVERNDLLLQTFYEGFDVSSYTYDERCGVQADSAIQHIDLPTLLDQLDQFIIVDVREAYEQPEWSYGSYIRIPLPRLGSMWQTLPFDKKICFICQKGIRSVQAVVYLQSQLGIKNVYNLKDGLLKVQA